MIEREAREFYFAGRKGAEKFVHGDGASRHGARMAR